MIFILNNKVAVLLLVLILLGLFTFFAFTIAHGGGWELADTSTARFCVVNDGVCTGM